jgi:hypothetical protein
VLALEQRSIAGRYAPSVIALRVIHRDGQRGVANHFVPSAIRAVRRDRQRGVAGRSAPSVIHTVRRDGQRGVASRSAPSVVCVVRQDLPRPSRQLATVSSMRSVPTLTRPGTLALPSDFSPDPLPVRPSGDFGPDLCRPLRPRHTAASWPRSSLTVLSQPRSGSIVMAQQ